MTPSALYTPLRYPGGKAKMGTFLASVIKINRLSDGHYSEPYAGGAGAALFLLFRGFVSTIHLNDIDPAVVAFWRAVTGKRSAEFAKLLERIPVDVDEWDRQRKIYRTASRGFELGFAFFYLNRTNRSGIMNAGVIGGRSQEGEWLIDARFNRADLARRIRAIYAMRRHIAISNADALEFIDEHARARHQVRRFWYLDPPYYTKGRDLYTNFYTPKDHTAIAKRVQRLKLPWLLTYDDCPEVRALYKGCRVLGSELSYSAREVRRGREVVVVSDGLRIPATIEPRRRSADGQLGFALLR